LPRNDIVKRTESHPERRVKKGITAKNARNAPGDSEKKENGVGCRRREKNQKRFKNRGEKKGPLHG